MRKLAAALLLCVLVFDVALDAFDADCPQDDASQTCHACVCGPHALDRREASSGITLAPAIGRVSLKPMPARELLLDKSTFHPPAA